MPESSNIRSGPASDTLLARDANSWLDSARALQRAATAGLTRPLLRDKNLGLLVEDDALADARRFRDAAQALGAHVAHIRPSLSDFSTPQQLQHTARLLGRLYDALECQGLEPALVQQIGAAAGVPVYDALAGNAHPTARLATLIEGDGSAEDKRRLVLQAVLLAAIA